MSALDTQVGGNHYRNGTIQPVQYIEANKLQYLEASVLKRITRHNQPGGKGRQDIEKAIHELQLLLELRYQQPPDMLEVLGRMSDMESARCQLCGKVHIGKCQDVAKGKSCLVCGAANGHGGLPCPQIVVVT